MTETNYNSHLQTVYPGTQWDCSKFSFGSINATFRVTKTAGDAGPKSLVLKHASPKFVDEDSGDSQAFSIKRQENESAALEFLAKGNLFRVPGFLRRTEGKESKLLGTGSDEEISILLIEDLGDVRNLRDSILAWAELGPSPKVDALVGALGTTLGTSLATMHSAATITALEAANLQPVLSKRHTDDVVWFLSMELLPDHLAGAPRAKEYFAWLAEDVKNPPHTYPPCLAHGDFNYGNILLRSDALDTSDGTPLVADWEFATSEGRGVNGDCSEFLSMLHCRIIGSRGDRSRDGELFKLLCEKFCAAYREKAQLRCRMKADDVNTQLYRSALLLSGRDVLTFASDACADSPAFKDMVKVGLWYFERAGANIEDFVKEENIAELAEEDEGLVRSLFIFE